ncbi:MAG: hypothetical protein Q4Q04_03550 [Methanocorpusculum sp.]|nr:hypothetical protein [Methanocorpusculum sp.]
MTFRYMWELKLSVVLVAASVLIYVLKVFLVGDTGDSNTLTYIFNALGFLPLNVLFVTLLINGLLTMRAKKAQAERMRMIVGLFFSELGSSMLRLFASCDAEEGKLSGILDVQKSWKRAEYVHARSALAAYCPRVVPGAADLERMRSLFEAKHEFLLRLVENPVFLEQSRVAELMQALFHLGEELGDRGSFSDLPPSDTAHLAGDVNRVYCTLAEVWLSHMEYLSENYPYLFSLSLRKSPFRETADVIVRE